MTAGLYSCRGGRSVLMLEKENFGGQIADSPRVENFPSQKSISGLDFSSQLFDQVTSLGASFELDEALSIEKKDGIFYIKGNYATYEGSSVIIATGVKHRHLGAPGEDRLFGHGVSYCAVCDGPFYANKDTMVIGDANSALQYALLLSKSSHHVDVVTLFDHFFAEDALVKALRKQENISITHNMNTLSFNGKDVLESVSFENTKTHEKKDFKCEGAFVAIGQIPDAKRFEPLVKLNKGYIETDENMATLTLGVYAAGDIRDKKVRQLTTAVSDGAIAALSASSYLDSLNAD